MRNLLDWEYVGLPGKEECQSIILPHVEHLSGALQNGWDEWMSLPEESRDKVSDMQRGGVVHDFIIDHAKGLLQGAPGILFPHNLPFFAVFVGETTCIRFKKLKTDYTVEPSSDMGRAYYNGSDIPHLSPDRRRLTCGYVLDPTGHELVDLAITSQIRDEVKWHWSITPASLAAPQQREEHVSPPPPEISLPSIQISQAENG